jgi:hypothetical protein
VGVGAASAAVVHFLILRSAPTPPPAFALAARATNELLFPVGCSLVLWTLNTLGKRVRLTATV